MAATGAAGTAGVGAVFAAAGGTVDGALLTLEGADLELPKRLACAIVGTVREAMVNAITAAAVERREMEVRMNGSEVKRKIEWAFAFKIRR